MSSIIRLKTLTILHSYYIQYLLSIFAIFKKIFNRYRRVGCNMDIMRQSKLITVPLYLHNGDSGRRLDLKRSSVGCCLILVFDWAHCGSTTVSLALNSCLWVRSKFLCFSSQFVNLVLLFLCYDAKLNTKHPCELNNLLFNSGIYGEDLASDIHLSCKPVTQHLDGCGCCSF